MQEQDLIERQKKALNLAREGQLEAALDTINQAVRDYKSSSLSYFIKGRIHDELLEYEASVASYKKCLSRDKNNKKAKFYLGLALLTLEQFDEGCRYYEGLDPRKVLDVERTMDLTLPGHLYAKSPIDMACWDIAGQAAGLPIADLMGGGSRTPRPIASSVGAKTVEETRTVMERYRRRGYIAHSVKIGGGVARDIARIRDVESMRRDGEIILYDVNRGWSRQQALRVMQATEDLQVMFEQPCETLDDIAAISGKHAAPVSVDESLVTLQDAARIARDGIAEIFGIKLNRVGGLTKAARMRDVALAHGIDMFVMATGGSVLADCEALQLAATIPDHACHAVWACQDMLTVDIAAGRGPRNQNGHLHLPEAPGLGVHPDEDVLGDPVAVYR